jgi:hypothetical protein
MTFPDLVGGLQSQNLLYTMLPLIMAYVAVIIALIVLIYFMYRKRHELDYRTGIKSGILTFITIFLANIVLVNIVVLIASGVVSYEYIFMYNLPSALIGGAFWGSVYVYFYQKIPGSTSIKKSFFLGSIIYVIPLIILIMLSGGTVLQQDIFFLRESLLEPIINYIIFSFFLGYFWKKYKSSR